MNLEKWKQSGEYFSYQNWKIFLKEEGKGENILLIHGFPTASFDWEKSGDHFLKIEESSLWTC